MKTYKVHLSIGWSGFVQADGRIDAENEIRFFIGTPTNIVARYAKATVVKIEELDWLETSEESPQ